MSSSSSSSFFSPKFFNCFSTEFHRRSSSLIIKSQMMMEILLSGFHNISTDHIQYGSFRFSFDSKIWNKSRKISIFSGYYDFSLNKRKKPTTHSCIVNCSPVVQVLKPRPILIKPNPNVQNLEPVMTPPEQTHVTESDSGLSAQIEKLVSCKRYEDALELFEIFECEDDYEVSKTTFDALVEACVELKSIKGVKRVFSYVTGRSSFEWDQYLRNRALLMHVKCGMMIDAQHLFAEMPERSVVSWNIIIGGLVSSGDYYEVFELFLIMRKQFSDVNARIFTLVIKACAGLGIVSTGSQLHSCVLKMGLGRNVFVSCVLIDMYCKCGRVEDAQIVFDEMPEKTVVGWNTIIAGYGLNGYSEEALSMYNKMRASGVKMDNFTCATIVRICSRLASVENIKQIHACLVRLQFGSDLVVNSALVDFYSKWGRIEDARRVFDNMPHRNLISWNALIDGYGNHGRGVEAVELFERMFREGMLPNYLTFRAVLSACSYSGLSDVGWKIFESMDRDHKIKPRAMHYACMIRLLGKKGLLDKALALINDSPFSPTENMWAALLTACRVHKNLDLGKLAAEKLYEMEPNKLSNYAVLLNIYRRSGRSEKVAEVIETLRRRGLRMLPACSCIEIKKQPHFFHSEDSSHIQFREIYKRLIKVMHEIAKHGYVPGGKSLLSDVDEQEERKSSYHSEKLAVACGLINTPDSTSLQVVQSHRICNDCHHVIKLIALVTKREIVVRDASRFHHFKNGTCSCLDYW